MESDFDRITFYDISMRPPTEVHCCSPNPWKTRYALNFKDVSYSTSWVPLPSISKVRRGLDLPATRKFADGSDFYTLPIISDPSTNSIVGDSFDIAVYLQQTYPNSGAGNLLPPQKLDYTFSQNQALAVPLSNRTAAGFEEYAQFNINVDAAFTTHVLLMVQNLPFDPATAEQSKTESLRRAGLTNWADLDIHGAAREQLLNSFQDALAELAKLYEKDPSGPFVLGTQPSYADCIVGGWLRMSSVCLPASEWEQLRGWHDGVFGRLHDTLQEEFGQMN
ncbi:uncharacterized protein TRUGW13939_10699 [Talaromyces rugulosus]|uniref:Uncharacterized protein n=1 Tax=Talaromyces rugulosus TaxID=121627 RepID=A0A7H8RBW5_TALRU|nr:uncharacterized protein TRUGW13939_10699 [Talaromyces rugulosus]QKX63528.1 hypothetical protein TRUGW13939_10699 [Talaromyces rugulosus]